MGCAQVLIIELLLNLLVLRLSYFFVLNLGLERLCHELIALVLLIAGLLGSELEDRRVAFSACDVRNIAILPDSPLSHLVFEKNLCAKLSFFVTLISSTFLLLQLKSSFMELFILTLLFRESLAILGLFFHTLNESA